ncbi:MAG: hypothetical protein WC838_06060, partial [Candidatus Margulisiibacteriota bacterium]
GVSHVGFFIALSLLNFAITTAGSRGIRTLEGLNQGEISDGHALENLFVGNRMAKEVINKAMRVYKVDALNITEAAIASVKMPQKSLAGSLWNYADDLSSLTWQRAASYLNNAHALVMPYFVYAATGNAVAAYATLSFLIWTVRQAKMDSNANRLLNYGVDQRPATDDPVTGYKAK